jgi:glycosyltransferase involved in cell wall biosynthesis
MIVLFDPHLVGHHLHRLRFMYNAISSKYGDHVVKVANKIGDENAYGFAWRQDRMGRVPIIWFVRFLLTSLNLLKDRSPAVLFNLAFDNTWIYFLLLGPLLAPVFRTRGIHLMCLQFRTRYLDDCQSPTDVAKLLTVGFLHCSLGDRFTLVTTQQPRKKYRPWVSYLPDIMDLPTSLPTKTEARRSLGIASDCSIVLFFGDFFDRRKGFSRFGQHFDSLPADLRLMVMVRGSGSLPDCIHGSESRVIAVPGPVTDATRMLMYRASDCAIMPYEESFAGSSGAVMDCIIYETPLIATPFPYARDLLADYRVGELLTSDSSNSWNSALSSILSHDWTPELQRCKRDAVSDFWAWVAGIRPLAPAGIEART